MIALLLLAAAPGAYAARTCGYDFYGRYRCSGLSNAARLGIGIGIAALSLLSLFFLVMLRRRRVRQMNETYITHPNHGQVQPPAPNQFQPSYDHNYQQWNQNQNNYPQGNGAWNTGAPMNNYPPNNQPQYAPPPGPPPPGYTPPSHPPPTKEHV
ncbi:hypothetical protein BDV93DRAFT_526258 [Ceratobasidium sp. AG-I]|nr:hypothetical protein BDV93DRAFT_526258 [Ceratobasidium sp. AG-I]